MRRPEISGRVGPEGLDYSTPTDLTDSASMEKDPDELRSTIGTCLALTGTSGNGGLTRA